MGTFTTDWASNNADPHDGQQSWDAKRAAAPIADEGGLLASNRRRMCGGQHSGKRETGEYSHVTRHPSDPRPWMSRCQGLAVRQLRFTGSTAAPVPRWL